VESGKTCSHVQVTNASFFATAGVGVMTDTFGHVCGKRERAKKNANGIWTLCTRCLLQVRVRSNIPVMDDNRRISFSSWLIAPNTGTSHALVEYFPSVAAVFSSYESKFDAVVAVLVVVVGAEPVELRLTR